MSSLMQHFLCHTSLNHFHLIIQFINWITSIFTQTTLDSPKISGCCDIQSALLSGVILDPLNTVALRVKTHQKSTTFYTTKHIVVVFGPCRPPSLHQSSQMCRHRSEESLMIFTGAVCFSTSSIVLIKTIYILKRRVQQEGVSHSFCLVPSAGLLFLRWLTRQTRRKTLSNRQNTSK